VFVLEELSKQVHPLVLGQAFSGSQSDKNVSFEIIIQKQIKDKNKIERILKFLCSESGSHDYTINRRKRGMS